MNKTLRFGYQSFGKHKLIKINAKISQLDADIIAEQFADIWITPNGKHGFRFEGCLKSNELLSFDDALKLACIDYKIGLLMEQAHTIMGKPEVENTHSPYDIDELDI